MVIRHRVAKVGIGCLLSAALFAVFMVYGVGPTRPAEPTTDDTSDRALRRQLDAATEAIRAEDWKQAAAALDNILRVERDTRLALRRDGKEHVIVVSAQQEAERLLMALPPEGRQIYEQTFGPRAAQALKEARDKKDIAALQRVVDRYLYTSAGVEALQDLATLHLDRGHYDLAALYYEQLLRHRGLARWTPSQLIQAAIAFRHVDHNGSAALVSRELLDRAGDGAFPLGTTRAELQKELDKLAKAALPTDWPFAGGTPSRNGRAIGGPPYLVHDWWMSLVRSQVSSGKWLQQAERQLAERGQPMMSAALPITLVLTGRDEKLIPLVVFRSHWGIHAVDASSGKLRWETPSQFSMDRMGVDSKKNGVVTKWADEYLKSRPQTLIENSTVGTLSTDGRYVYAIEDFEVPPGQLMEKTDDRLAPRPFADPVINNAVHASELQAYDAAVGKLKWVVGGATTKDDKPVLADSYFLSAPLPLDGKLYLVIERDHPPVSNTVLLATPNLAALTELRDTREVCLAALDPRNGHVDSVKPLFTHRRSLLVDGVRRGEAVHLAYGYGVLVCCAHTGTIVGIDRLKNRILWSYTYRDPRDVPRRDDDKLGWIEDVDGSYFDPAPLHQWKVTPPIIVDGKVIFTAADAPALTCLDVRRGGLQWSVPRGADDLYLAGSHYGKALVVGNGYVRAVSLADGKKVWQTPTGMTSGFGAFTDKHYYLPLKSAGVSKEPEICVLDADSGKVVSHVRSRNRGVPGNLVFFREELLSQTPTVLEAFPQIEAMLRRIDAALQNNPNDAEGLYRRAQLRRDKGDVAGAAEDLRSSLKNNPPKELVPLAREQLFEALTEFLQRDFDHAAMYLEECEALCKVDVPPGVTEAEKNKLMSEQRRRRITFLVLAGMGREKQGKLADALRYYLDLAEIDTDELAAIPTDPTLKVHLDRWALGRIEEMLKKATPEQAKELEDAIPKLGKESSKIEPKKKPLLAVVAPTPTPVEKPLSDRALRRTLEAADDAIQEEDWSKAATLLDRVLTDERDAVITVLREDHGKERPVTALSHQVAERLLAGLPQKGRDAYQRQFGDVAAGLLIEARKKDDAEPLRQIVRGYRYTTAGQEALVALAGLHFKKNEFAQTSAAHEALLPERNPSLWTAEHLYQAALAFRASGDSANGTLVKRELLARTGKAPVEIEGRPWSREDLQKALDKPEPAPITADWLTQRVYPERHGRRIDVEPVLKPIWRRPLAQTKDTENWLDGAEAALAKQSRALLSGATPVGIEVVPRSQAGSLIVYRSHWGIHAVDPIAGKLYWETPSPWSLDRMASDSKQKAVAYQTANALLAKRPQALFENSTVGTFSTDGVYVYAVEDLEAPPTTIETSPDGRLEGMYQDPSLSNAVHASQLRAFELATGKEKWEVGGVTTKDEKPDLADRLILGAPLVLDGKLYVAVEVVSGPTSGEVELAILEAVRGKVLSVKPLFTHTGPSSGPRRLHGVRVVHGNGVLVCCANTGVAVGVDLLTERLRWIVHYRDELESGAALDKDAQWLPTPPVINGDKVILAAGDSTAIHCLSLHDGHRIWSKPRSPTDLYLAGVIDGKVLVVGDGYIDAFRVGDGKRFWQVGVGTPSGFGAAIGHVYYLPIKSDVETTEPGIAVLDLAERRQRLLRSGGKQVPGNLLIFNGYVLSQTPRTLTAYPQAATRLKALDAALKQAPLDVAVLRERASLHRLRGEWRAAAADLHTAMKNVPDMKNRSELRDQLLETLKELFYHDAGRREEHWRDYKEVIVQEADPTKSGLSALGDGAWMREVHFLMAIALSLEQEKQYAAATKYYVTLVESTEDAHFLALPQTPETEVFVQAWARTRLDEMRTAAPPEQRKLIDEEIKKREKKK